MGVPGFFPWLVSKYPRVITRRPSKPENIYIDVNGLVHQSSQHDGAYDKDEARSIARAVQMVEEMVRDLDPTVLVYLAVDGPAPRAKSNQQRTRRFTSSARNAAQVADQTWRERDLIDAGALVRYSGGWAEVVAAETRERRDLIEIRPVRKGAAGEQDRDVDTLLVPRTAVSIGAADLPHGGWDSNAISVGTAFMDKLTAALHAWGLDYQKRHPSVSVIVSGVRTPGEGEHKFIDFIKSEREQKSPWYQPNASHVLVSGDTDLLFLALALHEPGAVVMRQSRDALAPFDFLSAAVFREYLTEELIGKWMKCRVVLIERYLATLHRKAAAAVVAVLALARVGVLSRKTACVALAAVAGMFYYARTSLLAVVKKLKTGALTRSLDVERVFDDFVALVCLLGNDFMPHMPSAYTNQGSLSTILNCYVRSSAKLAFEADCNAAWPVNLTAITTLFGTLRPRGAKAHQTSAVHTYFPYLLNVDRSLHVPAWVAFLRLFARTEASTFRESRKEDAAPGAPGSAADAAWQETYYTSIHTLTAHPGTVRRMRDDMCEAYLEAIAWVALYYLTPAVPSWAWYYRHYHAPTACDLLKYLESYSAPSYVFSADGSKPLQPLQQLMLIVPPASFALLPPPVRLTAMAHSDVLHPDEWKIDELGRLAVPLLPFVETKDVDFAEPGPQPEVLATPHGASYVRGGTCVANPAQGGYLFTPTESTRHSSALTPGTVCPPVTAVRRPCYIPWRADGQEFTKVGHNADKPAVRFKLLFEFEGRTPSSYAIARASREKFGFPCWSAHQLGFKRYAVNIPDQDVAKVRYIAENQLTGRMVQVESGRAKVSVISDRPQTQGASSPSPSASDTPKEVAETDSSSPSSPLAQETMWCIYVEGVSRALTRRDITEFFTKTFNVTVGRIEFGRGVARTGIPAAESARITAEMKARMAKDGDAGGDESGEKGGKGAKGGAQTRHGGYMIGGTAVTLSLPATFDPATRVQPTTDRAPGAGRDGGGGKGGKGARGDRGARGGNQSRNATVAVHPYDLPLAEFFPDGTSGDSIIDWSCHACAKHNYGSNTHCFRCKVPKDPLESLPIAFRRGGGVGEGSHFDPDHGGCVKRLRKLNITRCARMARVYDPGAHPLVAKAAAEAAQAQAPPEEPAAPAAPESAEF